LNFVHKTVPVGSHGKEMVEGEKDDQKQTRGNEPKYLDKETKDPSTIRARGRPNPKTSPETNFIKTMASNLRPDVKLLPEAMTSEAESYPPMDSLMMIVQAESEEKITSLDYLDELNAEAEAEERQSNLETAFPGGLENRKDKAKGSVIESKAPSLSSMSAELTPEFPQAALSSTLAEITAMTTEADSHPSMDLYKMIVQPESEERKSSSNSNNLDGLIAQADSEDEET